jgi:ankyrin repeat protein
MRCLQDDNGNTLLHVCAQNNLRKLARECIRFGCDVNAINNRGMTALDCSDRLQFSRMSELLVIEGGENAALSSGQGGLVFPHNYEADFTTRRGGSSRSNSTMTGGDGSGLSGQNFYTTRGMR